MTGPEDEDPWTRPSADWWSDFVEPDAWFRPLQFDHELLDSVERPPVWLDRIDDHSDDVAGRPRLCISRAVKSDDFTPEHTLIEYIRAAHVLGAAAANLSVWGPGWAVGQPFWFLVRQSTELALKFALDRDAGELFDRTHQVTTLLNELSRRLPEHPILRIDGITDFARSMQREDAASDGGRFVAVNGKPALRYVCCVDPAAALWYLRRLANALNLTALREG